MYKETITYKNFNDIEITEDKYFNLTKAELMQMELSSDGGYAARLKRIIATKDVKELIRLFTGLIDLSYGEKSDDGKHFRKSEDILADFKDTNAYSELYMKFVMDADAASRFINGIFPEDLIKEAQKSPEYQAQLKALNP